MFCWCEEKCLGFFGTLIMIAQHQLNEALRMYVQRLSRKSHINSWQMDQCGLWFTFDQLNWLNASGFLLNMQIADIIMSAGTMSALMCWPLTKKKEAVNSSTFRIKSHVSHQLISFVYLQQPADVVKTQLLWISAQSAAPVTVWIFFCAMQYSI